MASIIFHRRIPNYARRILQNTFFSKFARRVEGSNGMRLIHNISSFDSHHSIDVKRHFSSQKELPSRDEQKQRSINYVVKQGENFTLDFDAAMEMLQICLRRGVLYEQLQAKEQVGMIQFAGKISNYYIAKDFPTFCEYFYLLGRMNVAWDDLPREKRTGLLPYLNRFLELQDRTFLKTAEKFIFGLDQLKTFSKRPQDMAIDVQQYYERLLMRVLEERFSTNTRFEENKKPIAYAILFHLRALANMRGEDNLTPHQMHLIYKGFEIEWTMREVDTFKQALVILALGRMGVHHRSLPKGLWPMMMKDLTKKMQNKIKPLSLSSLLNGWREMGYKFTDMEEELKETVVRAVVDLCRDERNIKAIANVILYIGDMEADWEKDIKGKQREISEAIAKYVRSIHCHGRSLSIILLGLSNMKASWAGLSQDVQNAILNSLKEKYLDMNEQGLSNTLYSFGQLGLKWYNLPQGLDQKLLQQLKTLMALSDFIIVGLDASLNGLTNMRYPWRKDEELLTLTFKRINGWFKDPSNISPLDRANIPKIMYTFGEGNIRWSSISIEHKQALINGMQAYWEGEDIDAKKVSSMIFGLGNMGATIYKIPAELRESVELAVRKLGRKNFDPQAVANIMYSLSEMQYSWEMIGEETREALLEMIRQTSKDINAQGLCITCYSIAVMIRDNREEWEKSYFLPLQECLLRRYYELERKSKGKRGVFSDEALSQFSVYLTWLETLPSSSLSSLLQSLKQAKLPDVMDDEITRPSGTHKIFSNTLRETWRATILRVAKAGKLSEREMEAMLKVKLVDEYHGLKRGVFPMDVTIMQDWIGKGKIWMFIELDGEGHRHTVKNGELILETRAQLKDYLYRNLHPGVPVKRFSVKESIETIVTQVVKELWKLMKK